LRLDGNPTSASGLAAPISVMTPQALDETLRTSVLTNPVNRFERMLSEIAALRGRKLAARSTPPSIATAPGQKPGVEQHRGARTGIWTARVSDPVQDEALSQIMTIDPILLKPKAKSLFS
jgi:hypothetical protein